MKYAALMCVLYSITHLWKWRANPKKMKATGMRMAVATHAAALEAVQNFIQQISPNSAMNSIIPAETCKLLYCTVINHHFSKLINTWVE